MDSHAKENASTDSATPDVMVPQRGMGSQRTRAASELTVNTVNEKGPSVSPLVPRPTRVENQRTSRSVSGAAPAFKGMTIRESEAKMEQMSKRIGSLKLDLYNYRELAAKVPKLIKEKKELEQKNDDLLDEIQEQREALHEAASRIETLEQIIDDLQTSSQEKQLGTETPYSAQDVTSPSRSRAVPTLPALNTSMGSLRTPRRVPRFIRQTSRPESFVTTGSASDSDGYQYSPKSPGALSNLSSSSFHQFSTPSEPPRPASVSEIVSPIPRTELPAPESMLHVSKRVLPVPENVLRVAEKVLPIPASASPVPERVPPIIERVPLTSENVDSQSRRLRHARRSAVRYLGEASESTLSLSGPIFERNYDYTAPPPIPDKSPKRPVRPDLLLSEPLRTHQEIETVVSESERQQIPDSPIVASNSSSQMVEAAVISQEPVRSSTAAQTLSVIQRTKSSRIFHPSRWGSRKNRSTHESIINRPWVPPTLPTPLILHPPLALPSLAGFTTTSAEPLVTSNMLAEDKALPSPTKTAASARPSFQERFQSPAELYRGVVNPLGSSEDVMNFVNEKEHYFAFEREYLPEEGRI